MASVRPTDVEMKESPSPAERNPASLKAPSATRTEGASLLESENNNKGIGVFLDANVYATKKSIAQGMLDVALLTANASQLKYLLQVGNEHEFYAIMVALISTSIVLQILIGLVLVVKYRFNINREHQQWWANFLNNVLVWMILLATLCNVFISAFGIEPLRRKTPTETAKSE